MAHRSVPRPTGRYPFGSKTHMHPKTPKSPETETVQHAQIQTLGRFPHWNRSKPVKQG